MTTYDLKKAEIEAISMFLLNHPHAKLIRNYLDWLNFKVGDVLIRYRIDNEGNERVDNVSADCNIPKKFKVVYIDNEVKCPWVKNVCVRGGLGTKLYCLTESAGYIYKIDPEVMDCILMGVNYDPRAQYRNWRRENPNYGGKNKDTKV